jgi:hypothetical protein
VGKTLARSEWDFSTCPKAEVGWCVQWEYSRQIARDDPVALAEMLASFPRKYFPDVPYLGLPRQLRDAFPNAEPRALFSVPEHKLEVRPGGQLPHTWPTQWDDIIEVLSIGINWRLSDDALAKAFLEIVKARRGNRKHAPRRGMTKKQLHAAKLNRLGALRAWEFCGRDFKKLDFTDMRELYRDESAWRRMVKRAENQVKKYRQAILGAS